MTNDQQESTQPETLEPVCSRYLLLGIGLLSIGLGVTTNHWLYATSNKQFTGTLNVETQTVRAPVNGVLQSWKVEEGEQVDPHSFLCMLIDGNLEYEIQSQQREVDRLDARLKTLQAEVDVKIHEHLRTLDGDIYATELQTANLLQEKLRLQLEKEAWRDAIEQKNSEDQQLVAIAPLQKQKNDTLLIPNELIDLYLKDESARNKFEVVSTQLKICEIRLNKLELQKKTLLEKVPLAAGLSEVEIQLKQAVAELEVQKNQLQQQQVYSTGQGTISNFRQRPGDKIQAGEILADLYQMDEAFVVANVPCSVMHQFELDSTVKCLFPNGETRTGVVTHIAIKTQEASSSTRWNNDPSVPVRIEQTGALWPSLPVGGHVGIIR